MAVVVKLRRVVPITLLILGAGVGWPPGAAAHSDLRSSTPVDGAVLRVAPTSVTLVFAEPVQAGFSRVAVTASGGRLVSSGAAVVVGERIEQRATVSAAGSYAVAYRVVSADGHVVQGRVGFRYAPAASAAPSPSRPRVASTSAAASVPSAAPAPSVPAAGSAGNGEDPPGWFFLLVVGPVLLALTGIAVLLARSSPERRENDPTPAERPAGARAHDVG